MKSRALILGVTGQDGNYLARHLINDGYEVHGLARQTSHDNLGRIRDLLDYKLMTLHLGDVLDTGSLVRVLAEVKPHEIYNEADQDHVGYSFKTPEYSTQVTIAAVTKLFEAVRTATWCDNYQTVRVFQPVSATMFGDAEPSQTEDTPLNPLSPYACGKAAAYHLSRMYRTVYGMWISTAILYNHDSPVRNPGYFLQKVCRHALKIKATGVVEPLDLDYPDALIDIGSAYEYMRAAILINRDVTPTDYVVASGNCPSAKRWVKEVYSQCGLTQDQLVLRQGVIPSRPGPSPCLIGDVTKIGQCLGWRPKLTPRELVAWVLDGLKGEL